jgi:hypothetical protein
LVSAAIGIERRRDRRKRRSGTASGTRGGRGRLEDLEDLRAEEVVVGPVLRESTLSARPHTLAVLLALLPGSFKLAAVGIELDALTVTQIIHIIALVVSAVSPEIEAPSVFPVSHPVALVARAVRPDLGTEAMLLVVEPFPVIHGTVFPFVFSFSIHPVVLELSFVLVAGRPCPESASVGLVPLSFTYILASIVHENRLLFGEG